MKNNFKIISLLVIFLIKSSLTISVAQNPEVAKFVKTGSSRPQDMKEMKEIVTETFFIAYNVKTFSVVSAGSKSNSVTATTEAILVIKPETYQKATDLAFEIYKKKASENGYTIVDNTAYQSLDVYEGAKYPTIAPKIPDLKKNNTACVLTSPTGFVCLASSSLAKKMKSYKDKKVIAANVNLGLGFIEMEGKKNDFTGTVKTSTSVRIGFGGNMPCEENYSTPAILGKGACLPATNFNYYPRVSQVGLYLKDVVDVPDTKAKLVKASSNQGQNTGLSSLVGDQSYMFNGYQVVYDNEEDFVKEVGVAFEKLIDLYFKAFKAEME